MKLTDYNNIKDNLNKLKKEISENKLSSYTNFAKQLVDEDKLIYLDKVSDLVKYINHAPSRVKDNDRFNPNSMSFEYFLYVFIPACYFAKLGTEFFIISLSNYQDSNSLYKLANKNNELLNKDLTDYPIDNLFNSNNLFYSSKDKEVLLKEYEYFLNKDLEYQINDLLDKCYFDIHESSKDKLKEFFIKDSKDYKVGKISIKLKDILIDIGTYNLSDAITTFNKLELSSSKSEELKKLILFTSLGGEEFFKSITPNLSNEDLILLKKIQARNKALKKLDSDTLKNIY